MELFLFPISKWCTFKPNTYSCEFLIPSGHSACGLERHYVVLEEKFELGIVIFTV